MAYIKSRAAAENNPGLICRSGSETPLIWLLKSLIRVLWVGIGPDGSKRCGIVLRGWGSIEKRSDDT